MEIEYQKSNTIKLADIIGTSHISRKINKNKMSLFSNQLKKCNNNYNVNFPNLDNNNSKDVKPIKKCIQIKELHNNHSIISRIKNTTNASSKNHRNNKTRNKINNQYYPNKTYIFHEKNTINASNINHTNDPLFILNNNTITNVNNNYLTINLHNLTNINSRKYLNKQKKHPLMKNANKNDHKKKNISNYSINLDDDQFMNRNNKTINNSNILDRKSVV